MTTTKRLRLFRRSKSPQPLQKLEVAHLEQPKAQNDPALSDEGSHLYPNIATGGNSNNVMGNVHNHYYSRPPSTKLNISPRLCPSTPPFVNPDSKCAEVNVAIETVQSASKRDLSDGECLRSYVVETIDTNNISTDLHLRDLATYLCQSKPALGLSGAYLGELGMSCADYLDEHKSRIEDIEAKSPSLTRNQYKAALGQAAYEITVDLLIDQFTSAAELFKLFAYFHPSCISYNIVSAAKGLCPFNLKRTLHFKDLFDQQSSILLRFGLLEINGDHYTIPVPVRALSTESTYKNNSPQLYKYATMCVSYARSEYYQGKRTDGLSNLILHAHHLLLEPFDSLRRSVCSEESYLMACNNISYVFFSDSRPDMMLKLLQEILPYKLEIYGPDHWSTLSTELNIGRAYLKNGDYSQAHRTLTRVVESMERNKYDFDAQFGMLELANTLKCQNKTDEAELMFKRACDLLESMPDSKKKSIKSFDTNRFMGIFYSRLSRFDESESRLKEALRLAGEVWGVQSLNATHVLRDLAVLYDKQSKDDEFQQSCEKALEGNVRFFGRDNPTASELVDKLQTSYTKCGQDEKLRELRQRYALSDAVLPLLEVDGDTVDGVGSQ